MHFSTLVRSCRRPTHSKVHGRLYGKNRLLIVYNSKLVVLMAGEPLGLYQNSKELERSKPKVIEHLKIKRGKKHSLVIPPHRLYGGFHV